MPRAKRSPSHIHRFFKTFTKRDELGVGYGRYAWKCKDCRFILHQGGQYLIVGADCHCDKCGKPFKMTEDNYDDEEYAICSICRHALTPERVEESFDLINRFMRDKARAENTEPDKLKVTEPTPIEQQQIMDEDGSLL